jgi:uncharacterized protein (TIGR02145 family)
MTAGISTGLKQNCYFLTKTQGNVAVNALGVGFFYNSAAAVKDNLAGTAYFPVRLIKNTSAPIMDADGNEYTSVIIGSQEWLVENLMTTKYADGTPIPNLIVDGDWIADVTGAYCWYNNDIANKPTYGALYNWYAVNNAHGLAPIGWRVPSDTDFAALIAYVGGDTVAGGKLKEIGMTHFNPNTGATNDYGLGAGAREYGGQVFSLLNSMAFFRTSTGTNGSVGNIFINGNQIITQIYPYNEGKIGGSVRCMRDI